VQRGSGSHDHTERGPPNPSLMPTRTWVHWSRRLRVGRTCVRHSSWSLGSQEAKTLFAMRRKSPQQKKQLSYERDRRNVYGENSKSSRKNIRRNKRIVNRRDRHGEKQSLRLADSETGGVRAGDRFGVVRRRKRWQKIADIPLADVVILKLDRRVREGISSARAAEAAKAAVSASRRKPRT
jgi:hypothetical protein